MVTTFSRCPKAACRHEQPVSIRPIRYDEGDLVFFVAGEDGRPIVGAMHHRARGETVVRRRRAIHQERAGAPRQRHQDGLHDLHGESFGDRGVGPGRYRVGVVHDASTSCACIEARHQFQLLGDVFTPTPSTIQGAEQMKRNGLVWSWPRRCRAAGRRLKVKAAMTAERGLGEHGVQRTDVKAKSPRDTSKQEQRSASRTGWEVDVLESITNRRHTHTPAEGFRVLQRAAGGPWRSMLPGRFGSTVVRGVTGETGGAGHPSARRRRSSDWLGIDVVHAAGRTQNASRYH